MAATFKEANQVRLALKMKLSQFAWYSSSVVFTETDGFGIAIHVKRISDTVRKLVNPVIDGVTVKVALE